MSVQFTPMRLKTLKSCQFTPSELIARHVESPGTKAFTRREAAELFTGASQVSVETVVTAYDMRLGRRAFLPRWTRRVVPPQLGWFHVVEGAR